MKKTRLILLMLMAFVMVSSVTKTKAPKNDFILTIVTDFGEMKFVLYDTTPKHKAAFVKLVQAKYFDGTSIYRVIDDFAIQGGDPKDSANEIVAEIGMPHKKGVLACNRVRDIENSERNSSGGQFYIVTTNDDMKHMDNANTAFGEIVVGMEILEKIAEAAVNEDFEPKSSINISMYVEELKRKKISKEFGYIYEKE